MKWLENLFSRQASAKRVTTVAQPLVIRAPRLRFVNLVGSSAADLLANDKTALSQLFANARESNTVEQCDVLMLYFEVHDEGQALKELVQASRAPIVVVASENCGEAYVKASRSHPHQYTNLVLTIARNGSAFANFFHALFSKMFTGTTMPVAWSELAPQIPGIIHAHAPETIFACGAGHIRFEA